MTKTDSLTNEHSAGCTMCCDEYVKTMQEICVQCPIHGVVASCVGAAEAELSILRQLDSKANFDRFCREKQSENATLAAMSVRGFLPPYLISRAIHPVRDALSSFFVYSTLSILYKTALMPIRKSIASAPGLPVVNHASNSANELDKLLINLTYNNLTELLMKMGLLDSDAKVVNFKPGRWVGVIWALCEELHLSEKKAAIGRAFNNTFSISIKERTLQEGVGGHRSESAKFLKKALALLKK